jgi:branched-chain amino acid transport system ATP-binding protein
MNPLETSETANLIASIRDVGLAVLVIEHDMRFIFNLCDRVTCLVRGEVLSAGSASEVQNDPRVLEAYIGVPYDPGEEGPDDGDA